MKITKKAMLSDALFMEYYSMLIDAIDNGRINAWHEADYKRLEWQNSLDSDAEIELESIYGCSDLLTGMLIGHEYTDSIRCEINSLITMSELPLDLIPPPDNPLVAMAYRAENARRRYELASTKEDASKTLLQLAAKLTTNYLAGANHLSVDAIRAIINFLVIDLRMEVDRVSDMLAFNIARPSAWPDENSENPKIPQIPEGATVFDLRDAINVTVGGSATLAFDLEPSVGLNPPIKIDWKQIHELADAFFKDESKEFLYLAFINRDVESKPLRFVMKRDRTVALLD